MPETLSIAERLEKLTPPKGAKAGQINRPENCIVVELPDRVMEAVKADCEFNGYSATPESRCSQILTEYYDNLANYMHQQTQPKK